MKEVVLLEASLLQSKEGTHRYFDVLVNYHSFFQLILIFYPAQ